MSGIRLARVVLVAALLVGASGAISTARAQASGTLQASVTVVDDPVSRAVFSGLPALVRDQSGPTRPHTMAFDLDTRYGVRATVRELELEGTEPHVRVDVVYLN